EIADVRDARAVLAAVRGASEVFHFAAQVAVTTSLVDPVWDFDVNGRGTLNVLEAVRAQPDPPAVLFTSTNKVYGGLPDLQFEKTGSRYQPTDPDIRRNGISERRPLEFESPYGCSTASNGCAAHDRRCGSRSGAPATSATTSPIRASSPRRRGGARAFPSSRVSFVYTNGFWS